MSTPSENTVNTADHDAMRFETLVAGICSALANAGPENIDGLVVDALRRIGEALGGNRVLLGRTEEETGELVSRAQYRSTEPPFAARLRIRELNPWMWKKLRAGEVVNVPNIAAMPEEALVDQEYFLRIGMKSLLAVPVFVTGVLRYMLAVGSVGTPAPWPAQAVPRLRVLAEVLASTLMRCEAEQEVRTSEQLFRAFVEDAPVPIMLAPGPDGTPLYFNPVFTRVFGYTRPDLPEPAAWWPRAYPDPAYRAERLAGWERWLAAAEQTGRLQESTEAEIRTRDGGIRYAQMRLALIQGYKLVFFSDLTERRLAEAALRLTQYAVDQNPVIIFRINMEGRFVYANEMACRQFGYSMAELLTRSIWDISGIITREQWPARFNAVKEQGGTALESVYRRKDGSTFPVEVRIHYIHFSGEGSMFCFALDITARTAAQEAAHSHLARLQRLAAELTRSEERQRRDLAAILHDEIGQNLFAATTQLLALRDTPAMQQETVGKVLAILDNITQKTRELTFELCPPILYQMGLGPALNRLASQSSKRYGIHFLVRGAGAGPQDLNVRGLAYHAVRELFNNAAKHAHARQVSAQVEETGGRLRISVEDDGIGYDVERRDFRKDGFGLFQLSERVELLGGSLQIDSAAGQGCRVRIELPLEASVPE